MGAQHFNGTICTVLLPKNGEGKYTVELNNGSKATLPGANIEIADGGQLVPGARVHVSGLQASAGQMFNGTEAMLKFWSKENSKWAVVLKGGTKANIAAINVRS